jgi:hypothetical protein
VTASRLREYELLLLFAALALVLVQWSACTVFVFLRGRSITLLEEGEIILVTSVRAEVGTLFYSVIIH